MKELYTEIDIYAPAERVWNILTNFDRFPEWNPFIRQAISDLAVGEQLEIQLQPEGAKPMRFRPTVLKVQPNRELRWLGHLGIAGFFDGEHIFTIDPLDQGHVRFIQRETFKGLLVPILANKLDSETRRGFEDMNRALKARAEQDEA
jgi:hypothetical protein